MSDYTEAANYMLLAAESNDSWMKDRALRRGDDELTRLQSEVERLRGRCGELEADANRFKFIARRESHQSMAMVNYEIACISGENPTEDQFREAVDEAMESAQRLRQQADEAEKAGG